MSGPAEPDPELRAVLAERLAGIRRRMEEAARRAGRDPALPRLVVVSKTATAVQAAAAVMAGADHLGENRIQDALPRIEALSALGLQPTWHMIGHLQRNKVRSALEGFDRIDSIDSLRLARRVDRLAADLGRTVPLLLQVNASEDPAKHGILPEDLPELAGRVAALRNLRIEGLMTILFQTRDEARLRADFARMRNLRDRMRRAHPGLSWEVLSMGMTADFELAIEEGATEVRVGRAIFEDL